MLNITLMLNYPDDIRGMWVGFEELPSADVRQYCYVYGVLDLLNYMVLIRILLIL